MKCGAATEVYKPSEMALEPVTLTVVIYGRKFVVKYPSEQRVQDLMSEYATMCKGKKKEGQSRRFFVCIHCGRNDFSNKMMLNRHRYLEGCIGTKYADGTVALLLPYPDFKQGEGKRVEVMCKKSPPPKKKPADSGGRLKNDGEQTVIVEGSSSPQVAEGGHADRLVHGRKPIADDMIYKRVLPTKLEAKGGGDGGRDRKRIRLLYLRCSELLGRMPCRALVKHWREWLVDGMTLLQRV